MITKVEIFTKRRIVMKEQDDSEWRGKVGGLRKRRKSRRRLKKRRRLKRGEED